MSAPVVLSAVEGRVRLHFKDGVEKHAARLQTVPGVHRVRANPITQNVVVEYDPEQVTVADLQRPRQARVHQVLRRLSWVEALYFGRWTSVGDLIFSSARSRRWMRRHWGRRLENTVTLLHTVAGLALAESWLGVGLAAVELVRWCQRWLRRRAPRRLLVPPAIGLFVEMSPQAVLAAGRNWWDPALRGVAA